MGFNGRHPQADGIFQKYKRPQNSQSNKPKSGFTAIRKGRSSHPISDRSKKPVMLTTPSGQGKTDLNKRSLTRQ